ncbi:MAG: hypothetical protein EAZ20_07515 [Bacteroidetes bacterium]|nr:MAG: hypothetical protein EAZ20_07515 [Bacteroidota bacterium]
MLKNILICYFLFLIHFLPAQNAITDSLYNLLKTKKLADTTQVTILTNIAYELRYVSQDSSKKIAKKALEKAKKNNDKKGEANARYVLAIHQSNKGEYVEAIKSYFYCLEIFNQFNDKIGIARVYNNIGIVYYYQHNYKKAQGFLDKSLIINQELKNYVEISRCYNNMGRICFQQNEFKKAEYYYKQSIEIIKKNNIKGDYSIYFCNMAEVSLLLKNLKDAEEYAKQSFKTAIDMQNMRMQIRSRIIMAGINMEKNQLENVTSLLDTVFVKLKASKYPEEELLVLKYTYKLNALKKNFEDAHFYHQKYISLRDSIESKTNLKIILQKDYEYTEQLKEEQRKIERRDEIWIRSLLFFVVVLLLGLLFFAYRAFKIKNKNLKIIQKQNQEIETKNQKIEAQQKHLLNLNEKITNQKNNLSSTYKQLKDTTENLEKSLRYASKVQTLILPNQQEMKDFFENYFFIFKPKEVVSGDFYWFSKVTLNKAVFVSADCTGHGVPGAFMTMLGSALLHEIVNERLIQNPAEILKQLNDSIYKILRQKNGNNYDGMDIGICLFEKIISKNKVRITYSGSKSNMYYVENNCFNKLKGDRKRIGGIDPNYEFQNQVVDTNLDSTLFYFTTDGFPDQHDQNRKKLGSDYFQQALKDISCLPFELQKEKLLTILHQHQGSEAQKDDISVIGLKLKNI